jgi:hypothetical protein
MAVYNYDSNAIHTKSLTYPTKSDFLWAYSKLHDSLMACGLKPVLKRLNNEAPRRLQSYMLAKSIPFELVLPHNHQSNAAEKLSASAALIQTFQCISGVD